MSWSLILTAKITLGNTKNIFILNIVKLNKVIGAATLVVEKKFIYACSQVGGCRRLE